MNKIGIIGGKLGGYIWGADSTPLSHHVLALRASSSQQSDGEILFLRNKIENQFSKFNQCGRRNAYNEVKGRIRNEVIVNNLIDERSDTEGYDYDLEIALDKLDIDPEAKEIVRKIRRIRRKKQTEKVESGSTTVDADFGKKLKLRISFKNVPFS